MVEYFLEGSNVDDIADGGIRGVAWVLRLIGSLVFIFAFGFGLFFLGSFIGGSSPAFRLFLRLNNWAGRLNQQKITIPLCFSLMCVKMAALLR